MKKFFKDFGFIFVGAFLFSYMGNIFQYGSRHFTNWFFPLLHGLYYGIICYVIFVITMRLFKSTLAFFISSWVVVYLLLWMNIKGGRDINLTRGGWGGYYIFKDGEITYIGIIYKMFDPVGIMAVYSTILLITYFTKKVISKTKNLKENNR